DSATAAHRRVPWFVHLDAVAPVEALDPRGRRGGSARRERATRPRREASRSGAAAPSRWNGLGFEIGLLPCPFRPAMQGRARWFRRLRFRSLSETSRLAKRAISASAAAAEKRGGQ